MRTMLLTVAIACSVAAIILSFAVGVVGIPVAFLGLCLVGVAAAVDS